MTVRKVSIEVVKLIAILAILFAVDFMDGRGWLP